MQYARHVRHTPGFVPRVTFSVPPGSPAALARERAALWPVATDEFAPDWTPSPGDVLFLAGADWRYLLAKGLEDLPNPRLNLVQDVRHAERGHPLRVYLPLRAIRICVSPEVAATVTGTGEALGPVLTIPAQRHSLSAERQRFQALLRDVDVLWEDPGSRDMRRRRALVRAWRTAASVPDRPAAEEAARKPVVDFMVVGVPKGGTTALWQFLRQHPQIGMARPKEVHLFDAPDYVDAPVAELDERYRPCFAHCGAVRLRGEATPTYMRLAKVAPRLKRYNPALKLIVLLRDPAQRALSHHRMKRARGRERLPFALALLCEGWRLRRDRAPGRWRSASRGHAYRRDGLYAEQLANLYAHFGPRQVLVLRSEDLLRNQDAVLRRVFRFLGVDESALMPLATVFAAEGRASGGDRIACALLRLAYWRTNRRLRRLLAEKDADR